MGGERRRCTALRFRSTIARTVLIALGCVAAAPVSGREPDGLSWLPMEPMADDLALSGLGIDAPVALHDPYAQASVLPEAPPPVMMARADDRATPFDFSAAPLRVMSVRVPDPVALPPVVQDAPVLVAEPAAAEVLAPQAEIASVMLDPVPEAFAPDAGAHLLPYGDDVGFAMLDDGVVAGQGIALAGSEPVAAPAASEEAVAQTPSAPTVMEPAPSPSPPPPQPLEIAALPLASEDEAPPASVAPQASEPKSRASKPAKAGPATPPDLAVAPQERTGEEEESLRDAIIASLKGNPDIQIALARQDDARFGVTEASAGFYPKVDMTIAVGKEHNHPYNQDPTRMTRTEGSLTLNQNIWDFGTTANDVKRARAAYRSAQWGTREKIEAISYEITVSYLNVLERQKLLDLTENEIAAHKKILKMVTVQNDLGLTTPADVDRAKARLESVQSELLDRKSALEQAREAYRRLTDKLPARAVDLPSPAGSLPATVDEAVAQIDDRSPRMAQAVEDRRSLAKQKDSQTGTFFPRVGFQAQGNWKNDVQGDSNLNRDLRGMITVSYSFLNGGADLAVRNRIKARLREADYELDRRRREVEQDIRIDFNAMEAARAKISTIESEIVSAERVVELYRQQFREGKRSVFDLLDSQQLLFKARANQLTNGTAKMLSEFRVLQKLGGLFDLVSSGERLPPLVVPAPGTKKKD